MAGRVALLLALWVAIPGLADPAGGAGELEPRVVYGGFDEPRDTIVISIS